MLASMMGRKGFFFGCMATKKTKEERHGKKLKKDKGEINNINQITNFNFF